MQCALEGQIQTTSRAGGTDFDELDNKMHFDQVTVNGVNSNNRY